MASRASGACCFIRLRIAATTGLNSGCTLRSTNSSTVMPSLYSASKPGARLTEHPAPRHIRRPDGADADRETTRGERVVLGDVHRLARPHYQRGVTGMHISHSNSPVFAS